MATLHGPQRREYEQIVISAPGPASVVANAEDEEHEEIILEEDFEEATRRAFTSAVLAFMRAIVAAKLEPETVNINLDAFTREYIVENEGRAVVLEAGLRNNIDVRVEANAKKVKFVIVYPKRERVARRAARKLEKALMDILNEPLVKSP